MIGTDMPPVVDTPAEPIDAPSTVEPEAEKAAPAP
jgi:hypothetical protein